MEYLMLYVRDLIESSPTTLWRRYYYHHFVNLETETQRVYITCQLVGSKGRIQTQVCLALYTYVFLTQPWPRELLVCPPSTIHLQLIELSSYRNIFSNNPVMMLQDFFILSLLMEKKRFETFVFTTLLKQDLCHLAVPFCIHPALFLFCWLLPFQTSLFGEGTYLTSDLSLALIYSPHGHGWQHSLLGPILSCVAVCEVIDHPDVKCQTKKKGEWAPRPGLQVSGGAHSCYWPSCWVGYLLYTKGWAGWVQSNVGPRPAFKKWTVSLSIDIQWERYLLQGGG